MNNAGRIAAGIVGLLAATGAYFTIRANTWLPLTITLGSLEVTAALLALWLAAAGHIPSEQAMFKRVLTIGAIVGGIGFVAGFVGPMIFAPGNQGPLLGIFATGPAGFALGCLAAFAWVRYRSAKARTLA
jgi:hypothetical protein